MPSLIKTSVTISPILTRRTATKITEYLEGARVCDAENEEDLQKCMKKLREFHGQKLRVDHSFDLFGQMEYYESLWEGTPSAYKDYERRKRMCFS